jgi:hypothetical protein
MYVHRFAEGIQGTGDNGRVYCPQHAEAQFSVHIFLHTYIHTYKCLADEGEQCYSVSFVESSYIRYTYIYRYARCNRGHVTFIRLHTFIHSFMNT